MELCVNIIDAFSNTQNFDIRSRVLRWIKEFGIKHKVIIIIIRRDSKTKRQEEVTKVVFDCDRGDKYKEEDSAMQSATQNVVILSKFDQHRLIMTQDGILT